MTGKTAIDELTSDNSVKELLSEGEYEELISDYILEDLKCTEEACKRWGVITIPISQRVNPIKQGVCINLDYKPVSITEDGITYDFQDYINMLIDKKLNAEVDSSNPCNNCQEFDCTYCEYNHR